MTSELYTTVQGLSSQPQNDSTSPSNETPSPTSMNTNGAPAPPNSDLLFTNPEEYHRQNQAYTQHMIDSSIQRVAGAYTTPLSSMAKTQAQTYRPDVWEDFGPEVEAIMAKVPEQSRARVELWHQAVDMVAGKHVDQIARKMAEKLAANGDTGSISTGGTTEVPTPGSNLSPLRRLFATNDPAIQPLKEAGLTAEDAIAHAAQMGVSEEKRAEQLKERTARRVGA